MRRKREQEERGGRERRKKEEEERVGRERRKERGKRDEEER